jgi:hypothetical protein
LADRLKVTAYNTDSGPEALRATVALIGRAIKDGSKYVPIRMHASKIASLAAPKDYLGQAQQIYKDFVHRWRYVMDPLETELVTTGPAQIAEHVIGLGRNGARGAGDCDDATVALGSLYRSIGFDVAINTIEKPTGRGLFSHVFPSVRIPGRGWFAADPVVHPVHGFGFSPPHKRLASWSLEGDLLATSGQFPRAFGEMLRADISPITGARNMLHGIDVRNDFPDYGLENYGLAGTDSTEPMDWSTHAALGFGAYVDRPIPILDNNNLGLLMAYDDGDIIAYSSDGSPLVRTKMLEMDPREVLYAYRNGAPRHGAVALGDDGDIYQWTYTPMGGFFTKLFSRVKSGVRKVVGGVKKAVSTGIRWVGDKAKALIKKLPGGQYLLKIYDKVKTIGMKLVKPLMKYVGPLAAKIAPIAALIPGYGPAIAGALHTVGKMAQVLKKHKVLLDAAGRPKFKSGDQAKRVKQDLEKEAEKLKKKKEKKKKEKKKHEKKDWKQAYKAKMEQKYGPIAQKPPLLIAPPPPKSSQAPTVRGYWGY